MDVDKEFSAAGGEDLGQGWGFGGGAVSNL